MDTRRIELIVGAFVVAGIAALVTLALKVSSLNGLPGDQTYHLKAKFTNIGGLKVRSAVKVGGVLVGRVSDISLEAGTMTPVVEMALNKAYNQFPIDTSAKINTAGLLGEQYIALSVGGEDDVLKDGDKIADTQPAMVLEDLISKFVFGEKPAVKAETETP